METYFIGATDSQNELSARKPIYLKISSSGYLKYLTIAKELHFFLLARK